jgi:hypothetical protein
MLFDSINVRFSKTCEWTKAWKRDMQLSDAPQPAFPTSAALRFLPERRLTTRPWTSPYARASETPSLSSNYRLLQAFSVPQENVHYSRLSQYLPSATKRAVERIHCGPPRKAAGADQPHLMTDAAQESNATTSSDVTVVGDADQGTDTAKTNAIKSTSPSKEKRSAAPDSDAPKSAKKRRKVNHGMSPMPYILGILDSPANSAFSI